MADLDKFFEKPRKPSHPRVRSWRTLLEEGQVARLRVAVWREHRVLAVNLPRVFIHFYDAADREILSPEELDGWDNRLNDELLELAVPALDREHEARRFSLVLRGRFSIVEARFGDGYFNAVLTQYLRSGGLGRLPAVSKQLDGVHCYTPTASDHQELCVEMIEDVLGSCFDALYKILNYSKEQTISIMGEATAAFLDERFSVSDRRALGYA